MARKECPPSPLRCNRRGSSSCLSLETAWHIKSGLPLLHHYDVVTVAAMTLVGEQLAPSAAAAALLGAPLARQRLGAVVGDDPQGQGGGLSFAPRARALAAGFSARGQ